MKYLMIAAAGLLLTTGCVYRQAPTVSVVEPYVPAQSLVGRPAPPIDARAVSAEDAFVDVTLESLFGDSRYLLLVFYPGDFTFVCPTELTELDTQRQAFSERNCAIAGASVDSRDVHLAWRLATREEGGVGRLGFPLIADRDGSVARAYGVATENGSALRAWFILDKQTGRVRHQLVNEAGHGRSVSEALRVLDAIRFTDANSGVCPEGWTPGQKTIEPNRGGLLNFLNPGS